METIHQSIEEESPLSRVPHDVRAFYAMCECMKRKNEGMMTLTEADVTDEDKMLGDQYLTEVASKMDEEMLSTFLDSVRHAMEMTDLAVEKGHRYVRAYDELVEVIGEERGKWFSAEMSAVNAWLVGQAQEQIQSGNLEGYNPVDIIVETPRVAVQRMINTGVNPREMAALSRYLETYKTITFGGMGTAQENVSPDHVAQDEQRLAEVRGSLGTTAQ